MVENDYTRDESTMMINVGINNKNYTVAKLVGAFSSVPDQGCIIHVGCFKDLKVVDVGFDPITNIYHVYTLPENADDVLEEYKNYGMIIICKDDYFEDRDRVFVGDECAFVGINIYMAIGKGDKFELDGDILEYIKVSEIEYSSLGQTTTHIVG